jgi:hypothetical protein
MAARVAAALKEFPQERVVLELFNEPPLDAKKDWPRWQGMLERLHHAARQAAGDLPLMLSGASWDDRAALMQLDIEPFRKSNVLFTFHYYDPHLFTHQGVAADDTAFVSGLVWPVEADQAWDTFERTERAIQAANEPTIDRKAALVAKAKQETTKLVQGGFDAHRIARDFAEIGGWAKRQGIDPRRIVLGEFGCVLRSHGQSLGAARLAWLAAVRQTAEMEGFPWAYWAYKGFGGMELVSESGEFHEDLIGPLGLAP